MEAFGLNIKWGVTYEKGIIKAMKDKMKKELKRREYTRNVYINYSTITWEANSNDCSMKNMGRHFL